VNATPYLLLALLLFSGALPAKLINEKSRFLTEPWARPGTCAPYRLILDAPAGSTVTVEVHWESVVLTRTVAVPGPGTAITLPVPVAEGVRLVAMLDAERDEHTPRLPPRSAAASYQQPYVSVFAGDPLYARAVLPTEPGIIVADYFDVADFFTDWRLADGYDALVLFNPDESRLPVGAQRAIAEFCSLGGVVFVAGSFRFGEQATDIPAPGDPVPMTLRDVLVQRFGYGAGAVYRCEWESLRKARSARDVIRDAVLDHLWLGADKPPGGPAPTRAAPANRPLLQPGPMAEGAPGPLFWTLAGALLAACGVVPLIAVRIHKAQWLGSAAVLVGCAGIGGLASLQAGPEPAADAWALVLGGEKADGASALRTFVVAEPSITQWAVNLDDPGDRVLPRPLVAVATRPCWLADVPLAGTFTRGETAELWFGKIRDMNFRDFATAAREGSYGYDRQQGRLLDWWLESNAWRGRAAQVAPATAANLPKPPGCGLRPAGAIAITGLRKINN